MTALYTVRIITKSHRNNIIQKAAPFTAHVSTKLFRVSSSLQMIWQFIASFLATVLQN